MKLNMQVVSLMAGVLLISGCSFLPDYSDNFLQAEARGPVVGNAQLKRNQLLIPGEGKGKAATEIDEELVQPPQVITVQPEEEK